jgi:hypothetical protein
LAFAILSLLSSACSSQKRIYAVSGKVLYEGRPAVGAVVQFHPKSDEDKGQLSPRGEVGTDGTFQLTTFEFEDGAPAGEYAVTVFWGKPSKGGDGYDKILVPSRYLKPETSGLSAVVPEQDTILKPFILTR